MNAQYAPRSTPAGVSLVDHSLMPRQREDPLADLPHQDPFRKGDEAAETEATEKKHSIDCRQNKTVV